MPKLGHLEEFNPDIDDWDIYVERVTLYCVANSVKDEHKVAVLLTII